MSFLFDESYHKVGTNGVSPFQNMCAYLGGSTIQTIGGQTTHTHAREGTRGGVCARAHTHPTLPGTRTRTKPTQ